MKSVFASVNKSVVLVPKTRVQDIGKMIETARFLKEKGIWADLIEHDSSPGSERSADQISVVFFDKTRVTRGPVPNQDMDPPRDFGRFLHRLRRHPDDIKELLCVGKNSTVLDYAYFLASRQDRARILEVQKKSLHPRAVILDFNTPSWQGVKGGSASAVQVILTLSEP